MPPPFALACVPPCLYLIAIVQIANIKRTMSSSYQRRFVWARDSDSKNAQEHPAHLLLNNNNEELDTHIKFGTRQLNYVWIAWGSTSAIVQIPKSRIREDDLMPRRSRGRGGVVDGLQIANDAQDIKIKVEEGIPVSMVKVKQETNESKYNYDTDDNNDISSQKPGITPSPIVSSSDIKVKKEEESYNYDTDKSEDDRKPSATVKNVEKEEAYDEDTDNDTSSNHDIPPVKKRKSNSASTETQKKKRVSAKKKQKKKSGSKLRQEEAQDPRRASSRQKEEPRKIIVEEISRLGEILSLNTHWSSVQFSSFKSGDILPLDFVQFNKRTGRYEVEEGSNVTEDDVIIQAMVIFALYRLEKGWGRERAIKALSVWRGKSKRGSYDADDIFPLQNLWKEDIQQAIAEEKLGKTTLSHPDSFDNFPRFYGTTQRNPWKRRSNTYKNQVHIYAEQAAVQMALHLHRHVSTDYSFLASTIIYYALQFYNDEELMICLSVSLLESARKESACYPKTALDDLDQAIKTELNKDPEE